MDDNQFGENAKEQLEKEIEELQKTNKKNEAKKQMNIFDDKMQLLFTKHPNTTPNDLMGLVTDF